MAASTTPPPPGASPCCNSMPEFYSPSSSTGQAVYVPYSGAQSSRPGRGDMLASTPRLPPPPGASTRCNSMPEFYSPSSSTGQAVYVPYSGAQSTRPGRGDLSASTRRQPPPPGALTRCNSMPEFYSSTGQAVYVSNSTPEFILPSSSTAQAAEVPNSMPEFFLPSSSTGKAAYVPNSMPEFCSPSPATGQAACVPNSNSGAQSGQPGGGKMLPSEEISRILFDGYLNENQNQAPIFYNPSDHNPLRNYLSHQNPGLSHENNPYPIPLDHHPNAEALLHICCCDASKSKKKDKEQGKLYTSIIVIVALISILCSALPPSPAIAMDPIAVSIFGECPPSKWLITTYVFVHHIGYAVFFSITFCWLYLLFNGAYTGLDDDTLTGKVVHFFVSSMLSLLVIGITLVMVDLILFGMIKVGGFWCSTIGGIINLGFSCIIFVIFAFASFHCLILKRDLERRMNKAMEVVE